jgi:ABC-type polysaccharide/polyol phosphate transport system ATPase subunit
MIFVFQSLIYFSLTVMIDTCRLGQYKRADGNVVKKKEVREDLESELEAGLKIEQDVLDHAKDVREGRDFYIKAIDLSKAYKGTEEVQAIHPETCFGIKKGSVMGLLGPNGAGKSTTFSILSLEAQRSSGEVRLTSQQISVQDLKLSEKGRYIGMCP